MKGLLYFLLLIYAPQFWSSGITNASNVTIDNNERLRIDDHMQGIWKMAEDTNYHDYFIVEKYDDFTYSVTYMNRGGDNRGLEHNRALFIEVNQIRYLCVKNWDREYPGWVFFKMTGLKADQNANNWQLTANLVTDERLKDAKDIKEVKGLLAGDNKNPGMMGKDLHFRKKYEFNSFGK